mmetsp:Transcript_41570/g.70115  ORF Transcript_41570/g.70115 Transcript_41570/m.70115 type:complete len:236 (-) Transcript_41570:3720-4427(-)
MIVQHGQQKTRGKAGSEKGPTHPHNVPKTRHENRLPCADVRSGLCTVGVQPQNSRAWASAPAVTRPLPPDGRNLGLSSGSILKRVWCRWGDPRGARWAQQSSCSCLCLDLRYDPHRASSPSPRSSPQRPSSPGRHRWSGPSPSPASGGGPAPHSWACPGCRGPSAPPRPTSRAGWASRGPRSPSRTGPSPSRGAPPRPVSGPCLCPCPCPRCSPRPWHCSDSPLHGPHRCRLANR